MMLLKSSTQYVSKFGQWPQDWKKSVFIPNPKKGNAKECSNYGTMTFISHASKVMLKILQARLQQYMKLRTYRCTSWVSKMQRNQRSNCQHLLDHRKSKGIKKKKVYFCFTDHIKTFDCVDHNKLWKTLKEIGLPDYLTCL